MSQKPAFLQIFSSCSRHGVEPECEQPESPEGAVHACQTSSRRRGRRPDRRAREPLRDRALPGPGRYAKADAATLIEARKAATRLEAEVANGRTAMIYAITTEGRSALVTPATLKAMETNPMQQTYSTKFNARRAAEKAGTPADRIEVIKTPEGYSWRETPVANAASEPITGAEPASLRQGGEGEAGAARPARLLRPLMRRSHASGRTSRRLKPARGQAIAAAAGFQRGDPRPVPGQARAPHRSRGGGRYRRPPGVRDQSGVVESQGDGALSRSLRDRS